jgi:hypothetical protein
MRKDEGKQERTMRNKRKALMATPRGGKSKAKTKAQGGEMVRC